MFAWTANKESGRVVLFGDTGAKDSRTDKTVEMQTTFVGKAFDESNRSQQWV